MNALVPFAVDYGPILLATIFPFVRVLRGERPARSFFICWGLVAVFKCLFALGVPVIAQILGGGFPEELPGEDIQSAALTGVLGGWFYAAAMLVLAFVLRLPFQRRIQEANAPNGAQWIEGKRRTFIILSILVALGMPFKYLDYRMRPPREEALLQTFNTHRSSFDRLHEMLQADGGFEAIGTFGVKPRGATASKAADVDFPGRRFDEYLVLLKDVGARIAWRTAGANPEMRIQEYVGGSALGGYEIDFCNRKIVPDRQVSNLDNYFRNHRSTAKIGWVYKHIDDDWYLGTDVGSE